MFVAIAAAGVLASLSALHLVWVFGSAPPSASVIPHRAAKPLFVPWRLATLGVATLLALASACVLLGGGSVAAPEWMRRAAHWGSGGVALAFAGRAVGDVRSVGIFKRTRGTAFARADDRYFIPVCVSLAAASGWVAIH